MTNPYQDVMLQRLQTINSMGDSANNYAAQIAAQQRPYSGPASIGGDFSSGASYNPQGKGNTFENFVRAIAGRESGGNYGAVNPDSGALGKYQIMPGNISSWSKQTLGYSVTPAQFLHSPQLQEQVAQGMLRSYYNQWGPGGAAVAWYAGPGAVSGWMKNRNNSRYTAAQGSYSSINAYALGILHAMGLA